MVFLALATEELQDSLWCGLLVHTVDRKVTLSQFLAMAIWTGSICFQGLAPNAYLVICPLLRDIWGHLPLMAGLRILAAEQLEAHTVCVFATVSIQWADESCTSLFTIYMASHMSEPETTSSNPCLFPLSTSALVLSHPVNACIPRSALQTSSCS